MRHLDLLVIGGTRFAGRWLSELALSRGHQLTLLHRGNTGPGLFPEARHLLCDRRADVGVLGGERFDAVVDFCGFYPRSVRATAVALRDSSWYGYVSSVAAHTEPGDESAPLHPPLWPERPEDETMSDGRYGPLKVACEDAVRDVFGDRACVVRPGFVVGPHDPSDRFTAFVRRASEGGEMLLPGPADAPIQFVDARDLAAFLLDLAEARTAGAYNAVHPKHTTTWAEVAALAGGPEVRWVDGEWLAAELGDASETAFPLWDPSGPGYHALDGRRAAAAGLRSRPVAETVRDTLAWDREHPDRRRMGLPPERERELLARWANRPR